MKRSAAKKRAFQPAVPAEMKAAAIDRFGPPSVLKIHMLPVPRPGPGEVLIQLHIAGVGIWDAKTRAGQLAEGDTHFPLIPGFDGAGVIVELGQGVRRFRPGDRVWAYQYENPKGGFYAEYVVVEGDHVGLLPSSLGMLEGGAGAVTGLTALQGIDDHLAVRAGETVLIFGASGTVGTLAVQFAAKRRARVIAIASKAYAAKLEALGAKIVIDGRKPGAVDQVAAAAFDGLDAILALAGSSILDKCVNLVRRGGRIAFPNGVEPEPNRRAGVKRIGYDTEPNPSAFARLARAATAARLNVPIAATLQLRAAAKAHERLEGSHVFGRIALRIR